MMNKDNYCVIMAGGVGVRFWPLANSSCPKQFLDMLGTGKSFIRSTFERFRNIVPIENFIVVTASKYQSLVLEHIPEILPSQVLCEPLGRNTAPCVAYAAYRIASQNAKARIVVTPSDHMITNEAEFEHIIKEGLEFVGQNTDILTIGIKPSRPETGYGYIQIDANVPHTGNSGMISKVRTFTEKPNMEMAKLFVESGEFVWNSGIFMWSVDGIMKALKTHLPEMNEQFEVGRELFGTPSETQFIEEIYPKCQNISVDYGIMEKARNVYVRCGEFGWCDIGTWNSLYQHVEHDNDHNAIASHGKVLTYNTKGSVINLSEGRLAVIEGLDNYLVVEKDGVLLICSMENQHNIRNYVEDAKIKFSQEYI